MKTSVERCEKPVASAKNRSAFSALLSCFLLCACTAVSQQDEAPEVGRTVQALTSTQGRVFSFSTPLADWSSSAGTLGASNNASDGATSLSVVPQGWTEVDSVVVGALTGVRDTLSYDIFLPQVPVWGETRAILTSPGVDIYWADLGRHELSQLSSGYNTVSFPLSPQQRSALALPTSDLRVKIVVNAPALGAPYLLDRLVMTNEAEPPPPAGTQELTFAVSVVEGHDAENTFLSATDHISLLSQVRAGTSGSAPAIVNFGPFTTYLQAEARAHANVFSKGPVQLDVKTHVFGSLVTEAANIGKQGLGTSDAPVVYGSELTNAAVVAEPITWTVDWPTATGPDVQLPAAPTQNPVVTTLPPGVYGRLDVHSRNHVHLSSGTYWLKSFNTEPEAQLRLNMSSGPVFIYVKEGLPWVGGIQSKAPVFTDSGTAAQLLLAFAGTGNVFVQGSWQGTIVAPSSLIQLERPSNPGLPGPAPSHRGAFFGQSVELAAGQHTVEHVPFEHWDLLVPVVPVVTCVDSIGSSKLSAKFGYDNPSSSPVSIPIGPSNMLSPAPLEVLGQTSQFQTGEVPGAFRATFEVGQSLTWTVNGRSATADVNSPRCPLPVPVPVAGPVRVGDGPRGFSSQVGPLQPYRVEAPDAFFSRNFDDPAGLVPALDGTLLLAQQAPKPTKVRVSLGSRRTNEILQVPPLPPNGCLRQAIAATLDSEDFSAALPATHLPSCLIPSVAPAQPVTITLNQVTIEDFDLEQEDGKEAFWYEVSSAFIDGYIIVDDIPSVRVCLQDNETGCYNRITPAPGAWSITRIFDPVPSTVDALIQVRHEDPEKLNSLDLSPDTPEPSLSPAEWGLGLSINPMDRTWLLRNTTEPLNPTMSSSSVIFPGYPERTTGHVNFNVNFWTCGLPSPTLLGEFEVPAESAGAQLSADLLQQLVATASPTTSPACLIPSPNLMPFVTADSDTLELDLTQDSTSFLSLGGILPSDGESEIGLVIEVERDPSDPTTPLDGKLCALWNTDYVDEGFGEGVVGPYPASFAEYFAVLSTPRAPTPIVLGVNRDPDTGTILEGTTEAFLDADGCIPASALEPSLLLHDPATEALSLDMRVRSRLSDGTRVFEVRRAADAVTSKEVTDAYFESVPFLVMAFSGVPTSDWAVLDNGWIGPSGPVVLQNTALHGVTQVAATASRMMVEAEGLAIEAGDYKMLVGGGCDYPELTLDPPIECSTNADCTGIDTACNAAARVCGCQSDADCLQGRICANVDVNTGFGKCGLQACTTNSDCTGLDTVCNTATGTCGCSVDSDCLQGGACDVDANGFGTCGPPRCVGNADCTGLATTCDTNTGRCGCQNNAQCKEGRICESIDSATGFGQCAARFCTTDADCEGVDGLCNPNTNTCGCSDDTDCGDERTCENKVYGRCGCQTSADCPGNQTCGNIIPETGLGTCTMTAPGCQTDSDCVGAETVCTPDGTCGCSSASECLGSLACVGPGVGFGRCGVAGLNSCVEGDELLIGPPTLALNSKACTATGGECAVPGQACTLADGLPCPDGAVCQCRWVDQARWKYTIAHEAGHLFQYRAVGITSGAGYTFECDVTGGCSGASDSAGNLFDPPGADPMCGCAHIDSANRYHCLQSVELVADAEGEGFAQFFASRVFNDPSNPNSCTFNYYKEGLLEACPSHPDHAFDCEPRSGKVKVLPPYPVSCGSADKWRNNYCGGLPDTNNSTLAEMGTEHDWMQFIWSWNTRAPNNAPLAEIFGAYKQVCHPDTCVDDTGARIPGCVPELATCIDAQGKRIASCTLKLCDLDAAGMPRANLLSYTWLPLPTSMATAHQRSYRRGVEHYYVAEFANGLNPQALTRRDHFIQMALDHGVDENTSP